MLGLMGVRPTCRRCPARRSPTLQARNTVPVWGDADGGAGTWGVCGSRRLSWACERPPRAGEGAGTGGPPRGAAPTAPAQGPGAPPPGLDAGLPAVNVTSSGKQLLTPHLS